MTSAERRRIVEVMARAAVLKEHGEGAWKDFNELRCNFARATARAALSALLKIADVTIKETRP